MRDRGNGSGGEGRWGRTEKSRERGNYNQGILGEKRATFNKRKKKQYQGKEPKFTDNYINY